jgi:hypothetical protein
MIEHITHALYYFEVHLLYASMVWFVAWVLTANPRVNATTKYWIWVATAFNFIFPLGAVVDKFWGWHLTWARPLGAIGDAGLRIVANGTMFGAVWSPQKRPLSNRRTGVMRSPGKTRLTRSAISSFKGRPSDTPPRETAR